MSRALLVLVKGQRRGGLDTRFDELKWPLNKANSCEVPSEDNVFQFLRMVYKRTRMQPECLVMMVALVERL